MWITGTERAPNRAQRQTDTKKGSAHMKALAELALYDLQWLNLHGPSIWNLVIVFASIQGFFTNLYTDLTIFALAMATFFFAWAALLWMTSGNNERNRMHAQGALYAA